MSDTFLDADVNREAEDPARDALDALLDDAERRLVQGAPVTPGLPETDGQLSIAQTYLWSHNLLEPENPSPNRSTAFRFLGDLDVDRLSKALASQLERHPELRSSFPLVDGEPRRIDSGLSHIEFEVLDLRSKSSDDELRRLMRDFVRVPFDLSSGPVIRAQVLRIVDHEFVLHLVIHHIVMDAWSAATLRQGLSTAYFGPSSDLELGGEPQPASYSEYVGGQRRALEDGTVRRLVERTIRRLDGAPTILELRGDRRRPDRRSGHAVTRSLTINPDTVARIEAFAMREGVTVHMVLLSVFALLLHRYTGLEDILVGVPYAGRDDERFERTVGLFMNFLVLRADLNGDPSFRDLVSRIRADSLEMMSASDAPFELVARQMHPDREIGQSPLVQILFNMETDQLTGKVHPFEHEPVSVGHDLNVEAIRIDDRISVEWVGNADIFDVSTIERMTGHYRNLLEAALSSPETRINSLAMISTEERRQLLAMSTAPDDPYPDDKALHVLFEEWVERVPDQTAIFDKDVKVSYRELNERANKLAHTLLARGVGTGDIVPVFLERSVELVVSWIAVSKSGAAFVGLDSEDPVERIAWISDDVQAPLIIASGERASELRDQIGERTVLDPMNDECHSFDVSNPNISVLASDASYLLYTSGSTGTPKGVLCSHRSLTSLVFRVKHFSFGAHSACIMMSSPSFDAVLDEIWAPLICGGFTIVHRDVLPSARAIRDALDRFGINDLWLTASLFNAIVDESVSSLQGIDHIRTGGEALSVDHTRRAVAALPETAILNWYGPTEATIIGTSFKVPPDFPANSHSIPIGKPIAGRNVYILDRNLEPVPIGVPGEMFIGGDCLATCYLNDPELTGRQFVADPFVAEDGARMYRTGDLGRFLDSGDIEFLGRADRQIKLRGVRIEPGEIEAVATSHPSVRETVVVVHGPGSGSKQLVAFYTTQNDASVTPSELESYLRHRLSRHLVPAQIKQVDVIPRLASGKIDVRNLLARVSRRQSRSVVPPSTETERLLAELWTKALDIDTVGVNEDFFEIGGDSLAAVRLFAGISRTFKKEIPISSIYGALTIQEQAALLDTDADFSEHSSLFDVKPEGSNLPLFTVAMTDVIHLHSLGACLPEEQPMFGLQAQGLGKRTPTHSTIEEMAADYYREIIRKQPTGPYQLGGVCTGAIVAFQIAKLLEADGRTVRCLISFDTVRPPRLRGADGQVIADFRLREVAMALEWKTTGSPVRRLARVLKRSVRRSIQAFQRGLKQTRIRSLMYHSRNSYVTVPLDGPIDVLQSVRAPKAEKLQQNWNFASTDEVRFWPVTGTHSSMWDDQHIQNTASVLMDVLTHRRGDEVR